MRLIDADEIKKREQDVVLANGAKHRCFDTTMLFEIPTVDAVEVVRCKDCKFNYANQIPSENDCQLCVELPISDEFYCAYGEREEDEVTDG